MRQTARILSTYTADVSGVASALYELGGMVVIHDPSGCNSTYNTHDELRWYDQDSLIFISGLSEMDAILGSDDKLIQDTVLAAQQLSPRFIALAGTPIPMMSGVDFDAIAAVVEEETGIPTFGFATNGMHAYVQGAGMALTAIARRMTPLAEKKIPRSVNLLGVTPLDFALSGTEKSVQRVLEERSFSVLSCWAMGSTLNELAHSGQAQVNLVLSSTGFAAAEVLQQKFGTPYVVGLPVGCTLQELCAALERAIVEGQNQFPFAERPRSAMPELLLIGETVIMSSLAAAITKKHGISVEVLCPLETPAALHCLGDVYESDEVEIEKHLKRARSVAADPLFRHIMPEGVPFYDLPHVAFSGRIYAGKVPDFVELLK